MNPFKFIPLKWRHSTPTRLPYALNSAQSLVVVVSALSLVQDCFTGRLLSKTLKSQGLQSFAEPRIRRLERLRFAKRCLLLLFGTWHFHKIQAFKTFASISKEYFYEYVAFWKAFAKAFFSLKSVLFPNICPSNSTWKLS